MSEPLAKERPSIDLDDFERRLRQQDRHQEDPLAELARLVGQPHDPYREVFAQEAVPHGGYQEPNRQEPGFETSTRASDGGVSPRLSGDFAAIEAGLRGTLPVHPETGLHEAQPAHHEFYAQHEHYAQHQQYVQDDETYLQDHEDQQWAEAPQQRAPQPRSRRPIYAMVATIAVGVIGVGIAFAYKGASSSPSEIRTIAAASGPTKIQPPADASGDAGNPDVLGKNGQQVPTRLVSGEEQPVDISQAVQQNASRNPDAGQSPGDASNVPVPLSPSQANAPAATAPATDPLPTFGMSDMPAPKKVKVVSVRPDGTILSNDAPPPVSPAASPSDTSGDAAPVARPSTPKSATPKTATTKSAKPKTTSRVAAKPVEAAPSDDGATPAPTPKATRKAKPVRVASVEPTATPESGTDTEPTAAVKPGGGFAVQLAAPGSESEARAASSRLAKKFASALEGRRLGFHRAQSNGKSVFRVRVGSLSREDATSLCEKLKADGGSCFVAKNN